MIIVFMEQTVKLINQLSVDREDEIFWDMVDTVNQDAQSVEHQKGFQYLIVIIEQNPS
jgi:hypothetical protein